MNPSEKLRQIIYKIHIPRKIYFINATITLAGFTLDIIGIIDLSFTTALCGLLIGLFDLTTLAYILRKAQR